MSTTAPSTPENTPRKVALNRSFTLPAKVATSSRTNATAEIGAAEGIETLYVHPNCKVIKFTSASASAPRPGSSAGTSSSSGGSNGKLPWATLTEQTLAAGPLEIYRVPGSVSFLHSGALLHAILPRSNCWCVDGVSKFAMRVLPETYYRIELPGDTPEDLEKVEECKETLKKVLHYERTPCPFARTFTVDLPEVIEVKKTRRRRSHGVARKWKLDRAYSWKPEDGIMPPSRGSEESSESVTGSDEESSSSNEDARSGVSESRDVVNEMPIQTPTRPSVKERAQGFNLRSVTAPPQLPQQSTPPPTRLRTSFVAHGAAGTRQGPRERSKSPPQAAAAEEETASPATLRPFQSIPTDMPPSPPDSSAGFDFNHTEHPPRSALPDVSASSVDMHPSLGDPTENTPRRSNSALALVDDLTEGAANVPGEKPERSLPDADQWDAHPDAAQNDEAGDGTLTFESMQTEEPQTGDIFVTRDRNCDEHAEHANHAQHEALSDSATLESGDQFASPLTDAGRRDVEPENTTVGQDPSVSRAQEEDATITAAQNAQDSTVDDQGQLTSASLVEGDNAATNAESKPDPYAQIQARIQARRSIGGTTSFHPSRKSPTRQSSSSTASSASLSSMRSGLSRRSHSSQPQQQALASALVRKACAVFLGPPAHLVVIMLRIAARFAKGAFPSALMFESPAGMSKRVPGSFDLEGSDIEDFEDIDWDEEDDFGVPLRSPVRLAAISDAVSRELGDDSILRERRGWDDTRNY